MYKLTNKALKSSFQKVIRVGYCGAENLLRGVHPFAYNTGIYGWNWSVYYIGDGVVVCTGYRNLIGNILAKDVDLLEEEAKKSTQGKTWQESLAILAELRARLIERAKATL